MNTPSFWGRTAGDRRATWNRAAALLALAVGAAVLFGLPACDSGGQDEGEFVAEVFENERRVRTLEGRALFSDDKNGAFTIELVPRSARADLNEGVFIARAATARPAPGRYDLALPESDALPERRFGGAARLNFGNTLSALYYARSGRLTVESVSDDRLSGTFRFRRTRGERTPGGAPFSVEVVGHFEAERADADNVRGFPGL